MYLYAIGTTGRRQKIGFSKTPHKRLKTLQTGNPEERHLHYQFAINEATAQRFEAHVHKEHNHQRIKGEWFNMSPAAVISMMKYHEIMKDTITAGLCSDAI